MPADDQRSAAQKLFEEGSYKELVDTVDKTRAGGAEGAESLYLAAQALVRLEQADRAAAEFSRLRSSEFPAWQLVADSGSALLAGNGLAALTAARKAVVAAADNPWTHYQLGLAASKQLDFVTAVTAFEKCVELKPDVAYGHYYAALAAQKQKQLSKAVEHFNAFLRLAPTSPDRQAVVAIMRSLR